MFCRVLCETVKDFVAKVGDAHEAEKQQDDSGISQKVSQIDKYPTNT